MWFPTEDEAVDMFARFLKSRHRGAAGRYAREHADKLLAKGDFRGYAIWNRVADAVENKAEKETVTPLL